MAAQGSQTLPADLLHLVAEQLSAALDFPTLYNCVVSSKQLAASGAVAALYRISHESPVKSGGSEALSLPEQELNVQKWSILWRTIVLSALGKSIYPYSRHVRMLDLRDLGYLLDDDKFRGKISKHFFEGDLARFHFTQTRYRAQRLDTNRIVFAIGDEITQRAPLIEGISEPTLSDTLSTALVAWGPRLEHLRTLDLFDGKAFADEAVRNVLHAHCPNLDRISVFRSSANEPDSALAAFIGGMQENTLTEFQTHGDCGVGLETCLALNSHGKSLTTLQLALSEEGVLSLGLLQECTALRRLTIASERISADLKAAQNDVYLEIIKWLGNCKALTEVTFGNIVSAPDLIIPVLLNPQVELEALTINASKEEAMYVVKDHHDFHQALSHQPSLRRLHLRADPDPVTRDDNEKLMNALCSLRNLQVLKLTRCSDYFTNEHIQLLARQLPDLEDLYVGGYGVSDSVFADVAKLAKLKAVSFSGVTSFTVEGIIDFIDQLSLGNNGLVMSVDMADPDSAISQEEQDLLRELIWTKCDGRFEYQLLRDPNLPEFDDDDDSD